MYTVVETPTFTNEAKRLWSEQDHSEFCLWIAAHPDAGVLIPGSGGCRKVRWSRPGQGKRGGVRVIYFQRLRKGEIWLLLIYAKSVHDNISSHFLHQIHEAIEDDENE